MEYEEKIKVIHLCSGVSYCTAAYRINEALQLAGIDSSIICNFTDLSNLSVKEETKTKMWKIARVLGDYLSLFITKKIYSMGKNGPFTFGILGNKKLLKDIKLKEADIIHLHWINDGMLSISDVKKLKRWGKPIVITTHDMWFITGGCHVSNGCNRFETECGKCKILQSKHIKDVSYYTLKKKKKLWSNMKFYITSPSTHTNSRVQKSALFKDFYNCVIPNTLDTSKYIRYELEEKEKEICILFGAHSLSSTHKGFQYLAEALKIFRTKYLNGRTIKLLVLGTGVLDMNFENYDIEYLGYLNSEESMSIAYSRASVFVVPSIEDTFNQSVAEAMACKTPVVAFDGIGITDIVDHKINGYLAKYQDAEDLAKGIEWVLNQDIVELGIRARDKILSRFDYEIVGKQFIDLYKKVLDGQI